jgi:hypothetical protein
MQSESEPKCEQSLLAVAASLWEAQHLSFSRVRAASPTSLRSASDLAGRVTATDCAVNFDGTFIADSFFAAA